MSNQITNPLKNGGKALGKLSLGISMVIAVLIGVGIGQGLKSLTCIGWLLWVGVALGIAASFLNVYKEYKSIKKELEIDEKLREEKMKKAQKSKEDA